MSIDVVAFVKQHGVVLESAKGPVPSLAEAVAGTPIRRSWWNHPDGKKIFRATRLARNSERILVCRLVGGKITYVDKRLWPAVIRLAKYFRKSDLAAIREEHSPSGAHRTRELPLHYWVPPEARKSAKALSETEAAHQLGPWCEALVTRYKLTPSSSALNDVPRRTRRSAVSRNNDFRRTDLISQATKRLRDDWNR